jgi:short subunit dehydrogenase-like uncharacterized protein
MSEILLYGANGYTGRIVAGLAQAQGIPLILAGRNEPQIRQLAQETGLQHRIFGLDDPAQIQAGLAEVTVVLHCAGPFSRTAMPMAEACIATGTHYLDITGEIAVFERLKHKLGKAASQASVMLLPGVGFDVVPSDCLARHLADRCPDADHLTLAFALQGGLSHGTATTAVENIGEGGAVRQEGKITGVPAAWDTREFDFGHGPRSATTIPWGDVSTAYHSTSIPNISVYMATPPSLRRMMYMSRYLGWALASPPGQWLLKLAIPKTGPDEATRTAGWAVVVGEARSKYGGYAAARLTCPEAYQLTAVAALHIAIAVQGGAFTPGYQTPSSAFGPDLVLELPGVSREDLSAL